MAKTYALVLLAMTLIGVLACLALGLLRPDRDNSDGIVALLGFIGAATASLLTLARSEQNSREIKEIEKKVNGGGGTP